jgi:hypothetical protein
MGRVYDTITSNNKSLHALFDTGAVHNYIARKVAQELAPRFLSKPFDVGLGGSIRKISQVCLIEAEIQGNHLHFLAHHVIDDIGNDESGKEIDMILGAREMQVWNIRIEPKEEKLDLTRFRKVFIEY